MSSIEQFNQAQADKAHVEALRAAKLGRKLVPTIVKMVEKGKVHKNLATNPTYLAQKVTGGVDFEPTTLALNSELKKKGLNIQAKLAHTGNESAYGTLEVRKIDHKQVFNGFSGEY